MTAVIGAVATKPATAPHTILVDRGVGLAIAFVAFTFLWLVVRVTFLILSKAAARVVRLLEFAFAVAADETRPCPCRRVRVA